MRLAAKLVRSSEKSKDITQPHPRGSERSRHNWKEVSRIAREMGEGERGWKEREKEEGRRRREGKREGAGEGGMDGWMDR